ncbi:alpha/beta hydrolase family protein [Cerasicoccus frondis]|uniref:alpha/beta hydrolase family protein n=1 Tax=Cerasicoccus frondis TaxID=490090 RepID=UPI002852591B|nr:alpha/beta fold hydrolase [Cerasicoccus frondis]
MEFALKNASGETLDYTFQPGQGEIKPDWLIVLGHGVTGNKDRPVITATAQALNEAGFATLAITFSGNGNSEGDFREATISKAAADLQSVIDVVSQEYAHIGYVGHSMGCAVGVIETARDERIEALVSLAGMVDARTFAQTEFRDVTPDEGLMWDDPACPLSKAFMDDLCETVGSVLPQAKAITIPWLLLHGTADDVVLPRDTESVVILKGNAVKAVLMDGADHSFTSPAHMQLATKAVANWFTELVK